MWDPDDQRISESCWVEEWSNLNVVGLCDGTVATEHGVHSNTASYSAGQEKP